MENLYDILQCKQDASHEELKRSYQELILKYHPDKNMDEKTCSEQFVKVSKAWKILGDPHLREQFDNRWNERCIARSFPIQDEVDISEFIPLEEREDENEDVYSYNCRCGGRYLLTSADMTMKFDIVCCDTCSLAIEILYKSGT